MKFQSLLEKKFRACNLYILKEWSQLDDRQKESLAGMQDESEVYGVFEPVTTSKGLAPKVAYQKVALLYFHLQQNNKLPHYLIFSGDQKINETIAGLLLDGIIEIEWQGEFVSGPGALAAIYNEDAVGEAQLSNHLSRLSYKAIYYAWMLNDADERSVAGSLYAFNTTPWDSSMKMRFYDKHNVKDFLFSCTNGDVLNTLNEKWHATVTEKKVWLSWSRQGTENFENVESPRIYKLYISPLIHDVPGVLARCVPVINSSDAVSFKIGNTLQELLRPDKMVVYFYSKESLFKTAAVLRELLGVDNAQGVPFSSQLDDRGLLSWAEEPADEGLHSFASHSWRTMICDKLAAILVQAKENKLSWSRAIAYIEATMQAKGLDIRNWEPTYQFNN